MTSPSQLVITSWLDDYNGPAKLTSRQLELVTGLDLDEPAGCSPIEVEGQPNSPSPTTKKPTFLLTKLLKPDWHPNEIINMFQEEREKILQRGNECKHLLTNADQVLRETLKLRELYLYASPKTSQLHSECKSIIQERNDLKESFDRINSTLSKQEELRSIFRRMPDIKNQIISVLNSISQGYQNREQSDGTPLDEYYGRFFVECRRVKELILQLETCLVTSRTNELLLHLEEIYTLYCDIREQLIEPVFNKTLQTLVSRADRNYCDLLQQTCASLVRILRNEIQLFNQIFTTSTGNNIELDSKQEHPLKRQAIGNFLEFLCKIFYEHLRPVVIRINHLETLTELYKLLMESIKPEVSEESFQVTMSSLAEDIQERMVFRAEIFIQEGILDYKPSSGDLAYPEKLELVPGGDLKSYQSMWYPTVQRTVLTLVYLNRVFDPLTFHELAQEVVVACLRSLDTAQRLIDERHGGTKIEATLFLTKHLGIIRDQLQSYGIDDIQVPPEISQELHQLLSLSPM